MNIWVDTLTKRDHDVSPGTRVARWMRVLIVSIGALVKGPTAPEKRPIREVCHDGRPPSGYSGCHFCRRRLISV